MSSTKQEIKGAKIFRTDEEMDGNNIVFLWKADDTGENLYIEHPYKSPDFTIEYGDDPFIEEARKVAEDQSLDPQHPTGTVLVVKGEILGRGANGSDHHEKFGCKRKELGIPTGQGYELCEGCHPKNHSEAKAVQNAKDKGNEEALSQGEVTAYLYGHWWLCEPCSNALASQNVSRVVLSRSWAQSFFGL